MVPRRDSSDDDFEFLERRAPGCAADVSVDGPVAVGSLVRGSSFPFRHDTICRNDGRRAAWARAMPVVGLPTSGIVASLPLRLPDVGSCLVPLPPTPTASPWEFASPGPNSSCKARRRLRFGRQARECEDRSTSTLRGRFRTIRGHSRRHRDMPSPPRSFRGANSSEWSISSMRDPVRRVMPRQPALPPTTSMGNMAGSSSLPSDSPSR